MRRSCSKVATKARRIERERSGPPLSGRFHRILSRCLVDVPALGAFEDSQIRTVATGFDAGQHPATLARRAAWPQYRNERWFDTSISFGHVMLLPIWREHVAPPTADSSRFDGCDESSMARSTASHCSILLTSPENCRRLDKPVRPVSGESGAYSTKYPRGKAFNRHHIPSSSSGSDIAKSDEI